MGNTAQVTPEETNQITLVVPPTGNATRLQEFMGKVKQTFSGRILKTTGSWKETLVTLEVDSPATMANIVSKLATMPEVERAEQTQIKNHGTVPTGILVTLSSSATNDRAVQPIAQDVSALAA